MARLRHLLISVGVCGLLAACDRGAVPAAAPNVAKPQVAANSHALEVPAALPADDGWKSQVPSITATDIKDTLRQADDALARGQLDQDRSPGPGALELYLAVLALEPGNAHARSGVQSTLDALIEHGRLAARVGRFADARRVVRIAEELLPRHPDLAGFRLHVAKAQKAATWVAKAEAAAKRGRFTEPAGESALDYFTRASQAYPDFEPAALQRKRVNEVLLGRAWKSAMADEFAEADARLLESERLLPASGDARVMGLRIVELRGSVTAALLSRGNQAVDRMRLDRAEGYLMRTQRMAAQPHGMEALRERIHLARHYGPFKPGQAFAEKLDSGASAPEMVVIPYGTGTMGSGDDDSAANAGEKPAHAIKFKRGFAIARNEVTVADFRRFAQATGYRSVATRNGHSTVYDERGGVFSEHEGVDWRRDHVGRIASPVLPVVHVAWADAVAYAQWLSTQTGKVYRLPSEAQFEYVLRAGSTQVYPWGSGRPSRIVGNLTGDGDLSRSGRKWSNAIPGYRDAFWGPAPVRNFAVEKFGTFDLIGNVSEWTLDCWHESYQRAPVDGSAWVNPGCPQRVARGASWGSSLDQARSASRLPMAVDTTTARLGFRVVREL
ncbi:MAG: formylglycine-generating enzyme family protein [Frankiaceae bacterium]|nr:formylglycine-generating enzyme family protein [Arenimonas sp.]